MSAVKYKYICTKCSKVHWQNPLLFFFFQPSQKKFVAMMACLEKRPTTSDISGVKYKFISRNGVQVLTISPNQTLEFFVLPITYYSDTASLLSALATYKCSKKNRNENQARLQRIIRWNQPHPYHFAWIHPCSFFIVLAIIPTLTPPFWQFHFFFYYSSFISMGLCSRPFGVWILTTPRLFRFEFLPLIVLGQLCESLTHVFETQIDYWFATISMRNFISPN